MFEAPKQNTETLKEIDTKNKKLLAETGKKLNNKYIAVNPENEAELLAIRGLKKEGKNKDSKLETSKPEKKEKQNNNISTSSINYTNASKDEKSTGKTKEKDSKHNKYVSVNPKNEAELLAMRGLKKEGKNKDSKPETSKPEKKEKQNNNVSSSSMDYTNTSKDEKSTGKTKEKDSKHNKYNLPEKTDKPKKGTEIKNIGEGNTDKSKDLGKTSPEGEKTIQTETKTKQEGNQENASKENNEKGKISPEKAVAEMREKLGKPYIRGGRGETSKGYDCSGLITTVLYPDDIRATSQSLYKEKSSKIQMAEVKTGDFIYQKGHIQVATGPAVKAKGGWEVPIISAVGGSNKGYRQVREDVLFIPDGSKKYHAGRPKIFS